MLFDAIIKINCSHILTTRRGGVAEFFPKGATPSKNRGVRVYVREKGTTPRAVFFKPPPSGNCQGTESLLNLLGVKVDGQGRADSIHMRGSTARGVLPLVVAFEFKAFANRERRAE